MIIVFFFGKSQRCGEDSGWDPEHDNCGDSDKLSDLSGAGLKGFSWRLLLMPEEGKAVISAVGETGPWRRQTRVFSLPDLMNYS